MNTTQIIKEGDIIRFTDSADCLAAIFCRKHGITGKVLSEEHGLYAIDVGFHYFIYVRPHQLVRIIGRQDIPEIIE